MKYFKSVSLLFALCLLMMPLSSVRILAMETGFVTEEIGETDKVTFLSNSNINVLNSEPSKRAIKCFAVSQEGKIAVGQNHLGEKVISVYSSDGIFCYGLAFDCSGSFAVEWDNDNLLIFFVRSDVIISVNPQGEIEEIYSVNDIEENRSYLNDILYSTQKICEDGVYELRNDMGIFNWFLSSYSQLVFISPDGNETIIYDVNAAQLANAIIFSSILAIFVSIVVFALVRDLKKRV